MLITAGNFCLHVSVLSASAPNIKTARMFGNEWTCGHSSEHRALSRTRKTWLFSGIRCSHAFTSCTIFKSFANVFKCCCASVFAPDSSFLVSHHTTAIYFPFSMVRSECLEKKWRGEWMLVMLVTRETEMFELCWFIIASASNALWLSLRWNTYCIVSDCVHFYIQTLYHLPMAMASDQSSDDEEFRSVALPKSRVQYNCVQIIKVTMFPQLVDNRLCHCS